MPTVPEAKRPGSGLRNMLTGTSPVGITERKNSGLAQLPQKHQDGEGELQPSPVPEDIACESEVPSEADSEQGQSDDRSDAPGSQNVLARSLRLRRALRWDGIVHGSASCHGPDRREAHGC
jgi:hypothetical protein